MLVKTLRISNFLSFGEKQVSVELGKLNVLIGPNGSGKSNLLNVFQIAHHLPTRISDAFVAGNSPAFEWFHKSKTDKPNEQKSIRLEFDMKLDFTNSENELVSYAIEFGLYSERIRIIDEQISSTESGNLYDYKLDKEIKMLLNEGGIRHTTTHSIDLEQSVLTRKKDLEKFPELTTLGIQFSEIQVYSDWVFGKQGVFRNSGRTDLPSRYLLPDFSNLALIVSKIKKYGGQNYQDFIAFIKLVYDGIEEINVDVDYGSVRLFIIENGISISASRLSDGTLRFIALGAILFNPTPPPLVCIEEPELGLHPDLISSLAEAIKVASERMQIIITTHSANLVDCFNDQPEAIIVAEKKDGITHLERLDPEKLAPWLAKYRLGELWISGNIGGNRW